MTLLRAVGPSGSVVGYELREDFASRAQRNVERFLGPDVPLRVEVRDVYEGIDEEDLDRIVLDLPGAVAGGEGSAAGAAPGRHPARVPADDRTGGPAPRRARVVELRHGAEPRGAPAHLARRGAVGAPRPSDGRPHRLLDLRSPAVADGVNALDAVIVVAAGGAAFVGYRYGFLARALSWVGTPGRRRRRRAAGRRRREPVALVDAANAAHRGAGVRRPHHLGGRDHRRARRFGGSPAPGLVDPGPDRGRGRRGGRGARRGLVADPGVRQRPGLAGPGGSGLGDRAGRRPVGAGPAGVGGRARVVSSAMRRSRRSSTGSPRPMRGPCRTGARPGGGGPGDRVGREDRGPGVRRDPAGERVRRRRRGRGDECARRRRRALHHGPHDRRSASPRGGGELRREP